MADHYTKSYNTGRRKHPRHEASGSKRKQHAEDDYDCKANGRDSPIGRRANIVSPLRQNRDWQQQTDEDEDRLYECLQILLS